MRCLVFVLLNFSAEMGVGLLASGCQLSKMAVNYVPGIVVWDAWCLHFGTQDDHFRVSETAGAAGRTCGGLDSTFHRFGDDLGTPF